MHRNHMSSGERMARSKLAKLVHGVDFTQGSLVTMVRRCGKKACRCQKGQGHRSLYVSLRMGKNRKMIYIPSELEMRFHLTVKAYQNIRQLLEEVSNYSLERALPKPRR